MTTGLARLAGAIGATIAPGASALLIAPARVDASSSFETGRTPFYGPNHPFPVATLLEGQ